jgi:Virulence-associated protein E
MSKKGLSPEKAAELEALVDLAIVPDPVNDVAGPYTFIKRKKVNWPELSVTGRPKATMMNALMAIQELGLDCKLDVFHNRYTINGTSLRGFHGDLSDIVTRKIRELSFMHLGLDPGLEATYQATLRACEEHRFDPLLDYVTGLKWDGISRLDRWLTTYLGVKDTPLVREQGKIVLTAAVARIMDHGCKFDHVLVLEGPEGKRKSSVVQVLANGRHGQNENFSDSPILAVDERKQQELTKGVWFYELAELAGMRKGDQFAIKNFITRQEERARPAYGRFEEVQPRVCIFIGTFNTTPGGELVEYLNPGDQRRWWPVLVGEIDIPALERDRDQLFAEAMAEYAVGTSLYLDPALEVKAKAEATRREMPDPLADTLSDLHASILKMLDDKTAPDCAAITVSNWNDARLMTWGEEALPSALVTDNEVWVASRYVVKCVPPSRKNDGKGIAAAMRKLGWVGVEDRRAGPKLRGYVHKLDADAEAS